MLAGQRPDIDLRAVLRQVADGIFGQMVKIHTPHDEAAVLNPLPGMTQIAELDPLVARSGRVMVIGRIEPANGESVVAGDETLHITANRLLRTETGDALLGAGTVQFVGVGRNVPRLRRHIEKFTLTGIGVKHPVSGRCGSHQRRNRCVVMFRNGQVSHFLL
ncbi:MAG: hypothetical protein OHK0046_38560 [Anaerolineae bacterium]